MVVINIQIYVIKTKTRKIVYTGKKIIVASTYTIFTKTIVDATNRIVNTPKQHFVTIQSCVHATNRVSSMTLIFPIMFLLYFLILSFLLLFYIEHYYFSKFNRSINNPKCLIYYRNHCINHPMAASVKFRFSLPAFSEKNY